jgi:hypothetical protein
MRRHQPPLIPGNIAGNVAGVFIIVSTIVDAVRKLLIFKYKYSYNCTKTLNRRQPGQTGGCKASFSGGGCLDYVPGNDTGAMLATQSLDIEQHTTQDAAEIMPHWSTPLRHFLFYWE